MVSFTWNPAWQDAFYEAAADRDPCRISPRQIVVCRPGVWTGPPGEALQPEELLACAEDLPGGGVRDVRMIATLG
jgi:hypothetical protein